MRLKNKIFTTYRKIIPQGLDFLFLFILTTTIMWVVGISKANKENSLLFKQGKIVVGKITYKIDNTCFVEYVVNGKVYEITYEDDYSNFIPGEKFNVKYVHSNPKISRLLIGKPIFDESDLTKITSGIIVKKNKNSLVYTYEIDFIEYKKRAFFSNKVIKKLSIGDKFEVEYWIENSRRSIIYINKAIE